jgi:rhodanese-related sulfurtransferase
MKLKKTIAVAELRALLENKIPVQILDVRPKEEREEWIIPGSVFVDVYDQLKSGEKDLFSEALTPKNTPVITVCAAGKTSLIAMEQLRKNGIEAYSLDGGMRAWTSAWNTATTVDRLGTTIIQIRRTGKGCLSYLLESKGEVIVIDASLDAAVYSTIAKKKNWKIKYVIDTHIHARCWSSKDISMD